MEAVAVADCVARIAAAEPLVPPEAHTKMVVPQDADALVVAAPASDPAAAGRCCAARRSYAVTRRRHVETSQVAALQIGEAAAADHPSSRSEEARHGVAPPRIAAATYPRVEGPRSGAHRPGSGMLAFKSLFGGKPTQAQRTQGPEERHALIFPTALPTSQALPSTTCTWCSETAARRRRGHRTIPARAPTVGVGHTPLLWNPSMLRPPLQQLQRRRRSASPAGARR